MSHSARFASTTRSSLSDGFSFIRTEFALPSTFPAAVTQEADTAAELLTTLLADPDRVDLRSLPFVTLDPATSVDLDQAFCITEEPGELLVLNYAIADVGALVARGSALEREAWVRGETIYAPDERVPQYPTTLSEGVASLLPDGPRPAIVLEVELNQQGISLLRRTYRAVIQSTAKLAYETTEVADIALLDAFSRRVFAAERNRGALRVELLEQVLDKADDGSYSLVTRATTASEEANSALSLAANLAVANRLVQLGIGLFRVMDAPDGRSLDSLRRVSRSLGLSWPKGQPLLEFQRTLDTSLPEHRAFLVNARRAGGGASYATIGCGTETDVAEPFHAAIGAAYAHVTAPLRRLADRYVLDLLLLTNLTNSTGDSTGDSTSDYPDPLNEIAPDHRAELQQTFTDLVDVMKAADQRAAKVERAGIDLIEAVLLAPRVGEHFDAVVLEAAAEGCVIQLLHPPARARLGRSASRAGLVGGQAITVVLEAADPLKRTLKFTLPQVN
jgi:exoribonuclease R